MLATDQPLSERSHGFATAACALKIRLSLVKFLSVQEIVTATHFGALQALPGRTR
jgi:hypothetical protein